MAQKGLVLVQRCLSETVTVASSVWAVMMKAYVKRI